MPSLKDLKNLIASVKSTQKITAAMKMVAASKLRRAQEQAEAGRPYAERMGRMLESLAANVSAPCPGQPNPEHHRQPPDLVLLHHPLADQLAAGTDHGADRVAGKRLRMHRLAEAGAASWARRRASLRSVLCVASACSACSSE